MWWDWFRLSWWVVNSPFEVWINSPLCIVIYFYNIYTVKPRIKLHSKSNSLRMAGNPIILFTMKVVLHSNDFRCVCFQRSEWYLTLSRKATSFIHTPHVQNLPTENYCQVRVFYTGHSPSLFERNCKQLSFNGRFPVGCSHCPTPRPIQRPIKWVV